MHRLTQTLRRAVRGGGLVTVLALLGTLVSALPAQAERTQWEPNWHRLVGGPWAGRPAVGRNADGRLEVFVRGFDNTLWHIWQGGPNNGWSNPESLGGLVLGDPVVATNADGRQEVFFRSVNEGIYHIWQVVPNGRWSAPESLGNLGQLGTRAIGSPAVGRNADGRLEVFVRTLNSTLWHIWQVVPNGTWSGWEQLGDEMGGNPVVHPNADGRLDIFFRVGGPAGGELNPRPFRHIAQARPNGADGLWTGFVPLEGLLVPPGDPTVAMNQDGRLELFARGLDNFLHRRRQTDPGSTTFGPWNRVDGDFPSDPVAIRNRRNEISVFVRGFEGSLYEACQDQPNSIEFASPWNKLFHPPSAPIVDFAIGQYRENLAFRMEVFVRATDSLIYHKVELP